MCIAIHKPKGLLIPESHLVESFEANPDGAGFAAFHDRHGLVIRKGFMGFNSFQQEFHSYRYCPALVHFRIATSGGVNREMCHPFPLCGGKFALIHNGVINVKPHKGKSDTATFADSVLTPLLAQGVPFDSPALRYLVESSVGTWNKMLIMDSHGKVAYFNKSSGHVLNDIWYSNDSYVSRPPTLKGYIGDWKTRGSLLFNDGPTCLHCSEILESPEEQKEGICMDCWYAIWERDSAPVGK